MAHPNSNEVTPKQRSSEKGGRPAVYMRAVSKTGSMFASRARSIAAAWIDGTSR